MYDEARAMLVTWLVLICAIAIRGMELQPCDLQYSHFICWDTFAFIDGITLDEIRELSASCHTNTFTHLLDEYCIKMMKEENWDNLTFVWSHYTRSLPLFGAYIEGVKSKRILKKLIKCRLPASSNASLNYLTIMDVKLILKSIEQSIIRSSGTDHLLDTYLAQYNLASANTRLLCFFLHLRRCSKVVNQVRKRALKDWGENIPKMNVEEFDRPMETVHLAIQAQDIDLVKEALVRVERILIPLYFNYMSTEFESMAKLIPFLVRLLPCRKYSTDIYTMTLRMSPEHRDLLIHAISNRKLLSRLLGHACECNDSQLIAILKQKLHQ